LLNSIYIKLIDFTVTTFEADNFLFINSIHGHILIVHSKLNYIIIIIYYKKIGDVLIKNNNFTLSDHNYRVINYYFNNNSLKSIVNSIRLLSQIFYKDCYIFSLISKR